MTLKNSTVLTYDIKFSPVTLKILNGDLKILFYNIEINLGGLKILGGWIENISKYLRNIFEDKIKKCLFTT